MNKALRASISIALAITTLGIITATAHAAGNSNCRIVYGGGEVCEENIEFSIDKLVQTPNKGGEFVDNLGMDDARFVANDTVVFRIEITNTGEQDIESITVTDTLPENVTFAGGPGSANGRTLTYTITGLAAGETRDHNISVTVNDNLPADNGVVCLTNSVKAISNQGHEANDDSSFCVEEEVVTKKPTPQVFEETPVKEIPETGPAMLPLLGLIPAGIAGFIMRKKSKLS